MARVTIIKIEPGPVVLCDFCNKDYTDDAITTGGFIFGSKAICPDCAPDTEKQANKYEESHYIKQRARENEPFRDFVYRIREEDDAEQVV